MILLGLLVTGCAKTVKIDHEGQTKSGMLEEVPKWFVEKEGKNAVLPKEDVKELILRSPDYSDALMMKMWFELNKNETTIDFL